MAKTKKKKKKTTTTTTRTKVKAKPKKLVGFARLKVTDPEKFLAISSRAGKVAQKKYGRFIRWSAAEARKMARTGGKAVQQQYRKEGHPLQIAQARREARAAKIRAALRKKKRQKKETPTPEPALVAPNEPVLPLEPEPEPEPVSDPVPEKDVVNG